ncbi:MAG: arginase family protein [Candidatus Methanomethyliaceae archaeon]|nr:arginase family protein [Candidatus Methanomethyliaceae archaeon]MDW7970875.1 arginase family protein [Nitrososphaerota archaeon]
MTWDAYGVLFDPDEGMDSINNKINVIIKGEKPKNPYREILSSKEIQGIKLRDYGELPVESWLSIYPTEDDLIMLNQANFEAFLDFDGCREYRNSVRNFVKDLNRPLMIAIDHCLTGGVIEELSNRFKEFTLVVFDSHFDGIPSSIRNGLIGYMIENNSENKIFGFTPRDYVYNPFGRRNSYNSGSFLYHLVNEGIIKASSILVFGVIDYPSEGLSRINDIRVREYVEFYKGMEKEGMRILSRRIIEHLGPEEALRRVSSYLSNKIYVSVDLDIGARTALLGSRFINVEGLKEAEIYNSLLIFYNPRFDIIGLDITEIDPWRAGRKYNGIQDRSYNICGNIVRVLTRGEIYLDEKYTSLLTKIDRVTIKELQNKQILNELMKMGFIEQVGKYFKIRYYGKIV